MVLQVVNNLSWYPFLEEVRPLEQEGKGGSFAKSVLLLVLPWM